MRKSELLPARVCEAGAAIEVSWQGLCLSACLHFLQSDKCNCAKNQSWWGWDDEIAKAATIVNSILPFRQSPLPASRQQQQQQKQQHQQQQQQQQQQHQQQLLCPSSYKRIFSFLVSTHFFKFLLWLSLMQHVLTLELQPKIIMDKTNPTFR